MKINFQFPIDQKYHQYCSVCHSEKIKRVFDKNKTYYFCDNCQKKYPRLIVIDPKIQWWIDTQTKDYWHESIGIFLSNAEEKILLFERIIFPFAYSIPAGHLDKDENPKEAIVREVKEEVGLIIDKSKINLFCKEDVIGDSCRRGANNHRWHLFICKIERPKNIRMNDEGQKAVWLSLNESLNKNLTFPVRYFIEKYGDGLIKDNDGKF